MDQAPKATIVPMAVSIMFLWLIVNGIRFRWQNYSLACPLVKMG